MVRRRQQYKITNHAHTFELVNFELCMCGAKKKLAVQLGI